MLAATVFLRAAGNSKIEYTCREEFAEQEICDCRQLVRQELAWQDICRGFDGS